MTPTNYTTEKEYTGGNIFLLLDTPFADQRWATYRQWKSAGFQVQKGQKGIRLTKIVTIDDKRKNFKTDIDKIAELFAQVI